MDRDLKEVTADALELIVLNQHALSAAIEELNNWVRDRGALVVHENVIGALETLDTSNEGVFNLIRVLRE
ncbi:hypothetical protein I5R92_11350 [Pseudomonas carnis]|uniref:hypothetical protein n=1 Tax=Pseudomonas carnis TaxID=2487355 RepID=UPI0018D77F79|nr:hypothetical protein [Pseudomonas carnis]MBH3367881.1 hypothetical protein [Pseudomonas carnis]